jgi:hypothetical protein
MNAETSRVTPLISDAPATASPAEPVAPPAGDESDPASEILIRSSNVETR